MSRSCHGPAGNDGIALVLPVILVAVAATSYAVAGVVRNRNRRNDAGFVFAILSPIIVSAALTPLVATNGPAVLAWPVFALAVVLVALAVQAGRHEARGARS